MDTNHLQGIKKKQKRRGSSQAQAFLNLVWTVNRGETRESDEDDETGETPGYSSEDEEEETERQVEQNQNDEDIDLEDYLTGGQQKANEGYN